MQKAVGAKRSGAVTLANVHGALRRDSTAFWADFWSLANESGEHFVWKGPIDEQDNPVVPIRTGLTQPAREMAWVYVGRKLERRESLRPACRNKRCIRAEHQEVVRGGG